VLYNGVMPTPLLATKLFFPPPRPNAVLRADLLARLNEGLHRRLTLISAPAGFGKTSLVSAWIGSCGRPAAWLSLDQGDNDPARFLAYLVAALQTIAPTIGAGVAGLLQSPQPPSSEVILTALLNDISALPDQAVLVLDDCHVIDARPIDQALAFLVEHMPPQLHLVMTAREDPSLPLARLRVRGQLTELRAADLRFTSDETAAFLGQAMGLSLSPSEITALEARTEGWIAGLQLAALSMQGHQDVPAFIRAFTGDNRYIVDYLVEEVLERQPEAVRTFLLQTAILDRLHGPLCDAVTGQAEGAARLEVLHRGNFFVVPLDDNRQWYRYHHLFADVLAAHLRAEQPEQIATLHQRASGWYERHGSTADAIRHALAAEDFTRAADLIERAVPAMRSTRQESTVLGWLRAFPDDVLRRRPVLSAAYAWVLLAVGELDGVERRLRDAERWLDTMAIGSARPDIPVGEMVVVDDAEFRRLPGAIAVWRAGQAQALGNVADTVTHARRALDLIPEDDHLQRGAAAALLGLAAWANGDLEAAHRSYAEGMAQLQRPGLMAHTIGCALALGDIRIAQGRLGEAMRTYERGLQLATVHGAPLLRGAADMHVGMSELHREQNDLPAATQCLQLGQELGEEMGLPQYPYRWRVAMARIKEAQGDLDSALDLLEEAERRYAGDFSPNIRPVAALKIRLLIAQGRFDDAFSWTRKQCLSAQDELSYLREFEHITLARVLLASSKSDAVDRSVHEAIGLLERLLGSAEAGERARSVIEILVLLSLAHQVKGNISAALVPLSRALMLAEPEGYVRVFVDEGRAMAALLEAAAKHKIAPSYVRHLLTAFGKVEGRPPVKQAMSEPLSERERDVLRLLRTYLSGPEIARELVMSLNTLRTHTKNIYDKLGVNSRHDAVRRAEELELF
jgi:LuxR family transcriptional regulator, maltose regulon positive regulatory protein